MSVCLSVCVSTDTAMHWMDWKNWFTKWLKLLFVSFNTQKYNFYDRPMDYCLVKIRAVKLAH